MKKGMSRRQRMWPAKYGVRKMEWRGGCLIQKKEKDG